MDKISLREQIDIIDDKIAQLYDERMAIVKCVGEEKARTVSNIVDLNREKEIINRVTKVVDPAIMVYTKQLFNTLFDTSKAYQSRFITLESNVSNTIKEVLKKPRLSFPQYATVACQGVQGSYSSLATEKIFEISDVTYFKSFDGVFNAVEKGLCEYGMLPIENSSVGSVNEVYDLMKSHKFYTVKSIKLHIQHYLLANYGAKIEDIKEIYSHEQALNQCSELLKKFKNVKITICDNTATAAKMVAESKRDDVAAISSRICADLYNLSILISNIQNNDSNYTRFICISKNLKIYKNSNKISIMVSLPHESGSLNKMLSKFTTLGLNLTKLESRPIANTDFEFMFYFDFVADIESADVLNLIAELDNYSQHFTFLGSYNEV